MRIFWKGFIAAAVVFSMQSCVTSYVPSNSSATNNNPYKTNAKFSSANLNHLNDAARSIYASDEEKVLAMNNAIMAAVEKENLKDAIIGSIKKAQTIDNLLEEAYSYLGTPYRYGGTTRKGIDCSAFVLSVYGTALGIDLPRVAADQAAKLGGEPILDRSQLQQGDLIFFSNGGRISHVGMVEEITPEGEIKFIHAATSRGVMVSSLDDGYWTKRYRFAKRILN